MKMPGFTAEVSLYSTARYYRVAKAHFKADAAVYPAQSTLDWVNLLRNRQGPYYVWPDFCPPGFRPVLVRKCAVSIPTFYCVFGSGGVPHCQETGTKCISYEETPEWQCQLAIFRAVE